MSVLFVSKLNKNEIYQSINEGLIIQKEIREELGEGYTPSSTYKNEMTLCQQNETSWVSEF